MILSVADARHGRYHRRRVLHAAVRWALLHPPAHPTSYPTLSGRWPDYPLNLPRRMRRVADSLAKDAFYGRFSWLVWYGLTRLPPEVDYEVLASADETLYVQPPWSLSCCPTTTRLPSRRKPRPAHPPTARPRTS